MFIPGPCHPSRLKLLAKQTANPGAGGAARMWIGPGSSQVGDYPIPLPGFALALFFCHTNIRRGPRSRWPGAPRGPAVVYWPAFAQRCQTD